MKTEKEIRENLFALAEETYKEFHCGLVPGKDTIIGIRVPVLRRYAKNLLREAKAEELLKVIGNDYDEEIMLQGMIIGLQPKPDYAIVMKQIGRFVPKIDNWAVCDTFCAGLKITKKHKDEMFQFVQTYVYTREEFARRFVVVMLLSYYIEETYLDKVFAIFDNIKKEGYYVQMAVAWALSVCLVKYYDRTLDYLAKCRLDDFTYNKALQKAIESYRLTKEQKEVIRTKKRK